MSGISVTLATSQPHPDRHQVQIALAKVFGMLRELGAARRRMKKVEDGQNETGAVQYDAGDAKHG